MDQFDTLLERLDANVASLGKKELYRWADDKGRITRTLTYEALGEATDALASALVSADGWALKPGTNVLLVYPPGLDFIVAFLSCLKAGLVAVPVYPPRPGLSKDLSMFISVQSNCAATVALTNSTYDHAKRIIAFKQLFTGTKVKWPELRWIVTDESKVPKVKSGLRAFAALVPAVKRDNLAFLQYTSGSTSQPKGVMITHGNLGHNLSTIIKALNASADTVVVSWLPCYHDMGLIGSLLGAAYCGGSGTYMSPISFIKNPVLWLELMSKYRATHVQGPNFAYKLVVRKWKASLAGRPSSDVKLDLSSVRHIFNAAEPIEVDALDLFTRTFAPYKLAKAAMAPGYGLAENTVYVCDRGEQRLLVDKVALEAERRVIVVVGEGEGAGAARTSWVVGCGNPHRNPESGIQVRIVDEKSQQLLPDDVVGEIWIDSPSKAAGYFNLEAKTMSDFHAVIRDEDGNAVEEGREWLRSGDLGFIHESELFVCGRIKDLIIVRGRNHYPQDIEHTVEQADELVRPGCVAAFTTTDSEGAGEHLAVVAEVRDPRAGALEALSQKLRQRISAEHGVLPYAVVLIRERSIPKTTSGKISRFRAKAAFEQGTLDEVNRWVGDVKAAFLDNEAEAEINQALSQEADAASGDAVAASSRSQPALTAIGTVDPKTGSKLRGDALLESLKEEIARLIEGDPGQLDTKAPLIQLGMDSMALTQLKGILETVYGTDIAEVELFDEETTIETVMARCEGAPPADKFLVGGGAGAAPSAGVEAGAAAPAPAKPKMRKKKQSLFGCFKVCGL